MAGGGDSATELISELLLGIVIGVGLPWGERRGLRIAASFRGCCARFVVRRERSVHRYLATGLSVWPGGKFRPSAAADDPTTTFSEITDTVFNPIRQYGCSSSIVAIRLLETIATIAQVTQQSEDRVTLQRHAAMIISAPPNGGLPSEAWRREGFKARFLAFGTSMPAEILQYRE